MKKSIWRRIVAAVMTLAMVLSVVSVSAFAAQNDTVKKCKKTYDVYTCIGDSIAAGYGMTGEPDSLQTQFTLTHGEEVPNTYPLLLKEAVHAKKLNQTARDAYTIENYLRFLDDDYEHELNHPSNYYERFLNDCNYFQPEVSKPGDFAYQKAHVRNEVKEADLITINLGNNDIATNALFSAIYKVIYYTFGCSAQAAFSMAENDFQKADSLDDLVKMVGRGDEDLTYKTIMDEVDVNLAMYKRNYDRLIRAIKKINPDVDIYTIGMYDTFRQADPQGSWIQKTCSDASVKVCNEVGDYLKNGSSVLGQYTFVDDTYTECHPSAPMTTPNFWVHYLVHCHPDANGHRYIANQVIDAINANAK